MARYTEQELDNLKSSIDLVALIQSKGIKLEKHGKDLKGLCPFHQDKNPSMIITPAKRLFHCPACGASGDVIAFIQKFDGVSFRHAVELLRNGSVAPLLESSDLIKKSTVPKLAPPVEISASDKELLKQTIDYYHQRLLDTQPVQEYLKKRGIYCPEAIKTFKLGYADRTLGLRLPEKNRKAGAQVRESLQKLGLYRESGHEHFNGCLVMPIIDKTGKVTEVYGRKITPGLRKGTPLHLYLPGPHKGIFNQQGLKTDNSELTTERSVILCEALIDALTFWVHGFRNVTASYGTAGFTNDHLKAFIQHGIQKVYIAYDRDEAGDRAAKELAEKLSGEGIQSFRVNFPKGMDANSYVRQMKTPVPALKQMLLAAQLIETIAGTATKNQRVKGNHFPCESEQSSVNKGVALEPTQESSTLKNLNSNDQPSTINHKQAVPVPHSQEGEDHFFTLGERTYRVRGLARNTSFEVLKINLRLSVNDKSSGAASSCFYVDTFDFYNARHRKSFLHVAAEECRIETDVIKRDLGRILLKLEELQEAQINEVLEEKSDEVQLSEEEKNEALELLKSANLIDKIIADFRLAGLVGEDTNALVSYLAATSRKTDDPLAVIIQSSSSAGKSSVMDAALAFMPDEELIRYTSMTGQSLFYMGETSLKHKILAIAEEEGAEQAGYALKILQSEKKLKIASTGKDPKSGRLITQEYNVEGPCSIFMTTTNVEVDEELQNRCLVLSVNEDREQTKRIHELQRKSRTLEGMLKKEDKKNTLRVHQNAQRLIRPLLVVNPFAEQLTFLDSRLRTRRDHIKYLNLINAITLLHQHQREVKTVNHRGKNLEYIEATLEDIEVANKLAADIMGTSLDELAPQTRKLLNLICSMVTARCLKEEVEQKDIRFTRRQIRNFTGWGNTQLKVHMARLLEMEYLQLWKGAVGQQFIYQLLYKNEGQDGKRFVMNLIDTSTIAGGRAENSGGRPPVGVRSVSGHSTEISVSSSKSAGKDEPVQIPLKSI